jgi:hypothetical protein
MAGDVPSSITTGKYVRQIIVSAPGPQGPTGADGAGAENIPELVSYVHNQIAASTTWTIAHSLSFHPNVTVFDSGNSMVEGSVSHTNSSTLTITFSDAISGKAYLS